MTELLSNIVSLTLILGALSAAITFVLGMSYTLNNIKKELEDLKTWKANFLLDCEINRTKIKDSTLKESIEIINKYYSEKNKNGKNGK